MAFGGDTQQIVSNGVATEVQTGQITMLVVAGISLILGALAVFGISTKRQSRE